LLSLSSFLPSSCPAQSFLSSCIFMKAAFSFSLTRSRHAPDSDVS
jgi:hypothetical protein